MRTFCLAALLLVGFLPHQQALGYDKNQWFNCDTAPCQKRYELSEISSIFIWLNCNGNKEIKKSSYDCNINNTKSVDCVKSEHPATCECSHAGLKAHNYFTVKIKSCD